MVDEAYFHFHGETTMGDVGKVPNLMVARTFSKAYGLANLRVGVVASTEEIIGYMKKVSSPYNVNGVALECLPAAIADEDYVRWYVDQVTRGRKRIMDGLDALGVEYFPSAANFVLMKIGPKHKQLVEAMRRQGVLLRDRSTDPGCDGFVRITIGVEEQVHTGPGSAGRDRSRRSRWTRERKSRTHSQAQDDRDADRADADDRRAGHVPRSRPASASSITCWSCSRAMAAST